MSTPVASSSPSPAISSKQRSPGHARRKTRIVRRRGRAKGELESEDEIVREVATDSETEDDLSTTDSDSDTEPVSEGVIAGGHSRPITPSTSDSPQSHNKEIPTHINADPQPFFSQPSTWEEMVTEESAHGPAELPVIDFADFNGGAVPNGHVPRPLSSKSKKPLEGSRDRSPRSETKANKEDDADHVRSTSRRSRSSTSRRLTGQSARQAYQQRLESDPSFVPTVGGFWGHDERLLDKDLRSLSGWWRGRWQSRGRGRGLMRGRGGYNQRSSHDSEDNGNATDLPAIERTWTHDGFEEMKRKEEQRRTAVQQQQPTNQTRGGPSGRGGFATGRSSRGGATRGGQPPASAPTTAHPQGRVWFAMKPELMWTKQHEAFLFFDSSTKPRKGQGLSFRVKLPGSDRHLVHSKFQTRQTDMEQRLPNPETLATDSGDNAYTIRIPKAARKEKAMEPLTTVEEASLEDIFTVRPNLVTPIPIPIPIPESDGKLSISATTSSKKPSSTDGQQENEPPSEQTLISQLEKLTVLPQDSDQARLARTEEAVLKNGSSEQSSSTNDQRPNLPPLQTVFTPPPGAHTSPVYGAAYPYGPTLPPGVALNAHGLPYELATGRPVVLAPPPPMYTPRPLMPHMTPGAVYMSSHMSPDFVSQSSSHTPSMNGFVDPATGTPLFALPRQTRIEIRAPADEFDGKGSRKSQPRQLTTRTPISSPPQPSYPTLTRSREAIGSPPYVGTEARDLQAANGDISNHQRADSHLVPYASYYYYPDSYGYYPYMDMTQVGQYDAYSSDPRGAQGTVYY